MMALAIVAAVALAQATVTDLGKLRTAPAKELTYGDVRPKYCLLVFGQEAEVRMWLVAAGAVAYLDRNANGDLTEAEESVAETRGFFQFQKVIVDAERTVVVNVALARSPDAEDRVSTDLPAGGGTIKMIQTTVDDASGGLKFGSSPDSAPVVHFNGPLRMAARTGTMHRRGDNDASFAVMIGTAGLGSGSFAAMACARVLENVHPRVTIDLSSAGSRIGGSPQLVPLMDRC